MGGPRFGKYLLGERLATGGMAEIFLATARGPYGFSRRVVIKRLLPHLAARPDLVALFLDEARLLAGLHHPRIVQVLDLGGEGDAYFQALEHLEGNDLGVALRRLAARKESLPVDACLRIATALAEGLSYVHGARSESGQPLEIVHGDLAPGNVMLTRQGEVKLIDFGVARWAGRPAAAPAGGTPGYIAPELLAGGPIDRRADLYGLGMLLGQLLAQSQAPPRAAELARALSEVRPEARPQSADEVLAALNACLRELGPMRPLAQQLRPLLSIERRRFALADLGGATLLLTAPSRALQAAAALSLQVAQAPVQLVSFARRWARPRIIATGVGLGLIGFTAGFYAGAHCPRPTPLSHAAAAEHLRPPAEAAPPRPPRRSLHRGRSRSKN